MRVSFVCFRLLCNFLFLLQTGFMSCLMLYWIFQKLLLLLMALDAAIRSVVLLIVFFKILNKKRKASSITFPYTRMVQLSIYWTRLATRWERASLGVGTAPPVFGLSSPQAACSTIGQATPLSKSWSWDFWRDARIPKLVVSISFLNFYFILNVHTLETLCGMLSFLLVGISFYQASVLSARHAMIHFILLPALFWMKSQF